VYFTQPTADLIGRWLVDHPGGAWLFCGLHRRLGQQMTVDSLYQMFRRRGADRGVTGIHNPHGVRHLVGQAAAQNLGVRDAQLLLGHLDISSTMVYASPDESRLREVVGMVKPLG
jgi:site-specific recombinase XerC